MTASLVVAEFRGDIGRRTQTRVRFQRDANSAGSLQANEQVRQRLSRPRDNRGRVFTDPRGFVGLEGQVSIQVFEGHDAVTPRGLDGKAEILPVLSDPGTQDSALRFIRVVVEPDDRGQGVCRYAALPKSPPALADGLMLVFQQPAMFLPGGRNDRSGSMRWPWSPQKRRSGRATRAGSTSMCPRAPKSPPAH